LFQPQARLSCHHEQSDDFDYAHAKRYQFNGERVTTGNNANKELTQLVERATTTTTRGTTSY
jgi:hypothetical protein